MLTSKYANDDNECMFKVKIFVDVGGVYTRLGTQRKKKDVRDRKMRRTLFFFFLFFFVVVLNEMFFL
jgi:hypothetical protein